MNFLLGVLIFLALVFLAPIIEALIGEIKWEDAMWEIDMWRVIILSFLAIVSSFVGIGLFIFGLFVKSKTMMWIGGVLMIPTIIYGVYSDWKEKKEKRSKKKHKTK